MKYRWLCTALLGTGLAAGCVERRYVITSDPPGALVLRNGVPIGATPVDDHFVYYGTYHFTLVKDGYATAQVDQCVSTPWYEYFPLDFVSEALYPGHIEDVRRFHYTLQPVEAVNPNALREQAERLRAEGRSIGPPAPVASPLPVAGPPPP